MSRDEAIVHTTLPSGLRLTLLIQGRGRADVPGKRTATYTVQPDPQQGVRPSGVVLFSYYDRGRYLTDAAEEAKAILKAAETVGLVSGTSTQYAASSIAEVKMALDGVESMTVDERMN